MFSPDQTLATFDPELAKAISQEDARQEPQNPKTPTFELKILMSDLHLLRNDTFETLFQTVKREIAQVSEHIQDTAGFFKDSNEHRSLESIQVSNFTHSK